MTEASDAAFSKACQLIHQTRQNGTTTLTFGNDPVFRHLDRIPAEIIDVVDLTSLVLSRTQVSDLRPIAGLTHLTFLMLDHTQVADLTPLCGMTGLTSLILAATPVLTFDPLTHLTAMWSLDLRASKILDLRVLSPMKGLTRLNLADTHIADISPLSNLTCLDGLNLSNSQVADLRPILGLPQLLSPHLFGQGLRFNGTAATRLDKTIRQISQFGDPASQARDLFAYLQDWVPPRGKHPAPRSFKR